MADIGKNPKEYPCVPSDPSLRSAIDALFESFPPVNEMANKVNSSLDEMGAHLKKFSQDLEKQISAAAKEKNASSGK